MPPGNGTPAAAFPAAELRVTLIDQNAQADRRHLACALSRPGARLRTRRRWTWTCIRPSFQQADFLGDRGPSRGPARVFVCLDDDSLKPLGGAGAGPAQPRPATRPSSCAWPRTPGLAVLLRDVDAGSGSFQHLRAFGLLDRTCHPDQVLRGTHEILARAIHEDYLRQQSAAGVTPGAEPLDGARGTPCRSISRNPTASRPTTSGPSSRPCSAVPRRCWTGTSRSSSSRPEEIERLARMEHDRWMAAKLRRRLASRPEEGQRRQNPPLPGALRSTPARRTGQGPQRRATDPRHAGQGRLPGSPAHLASRRGKRRGKPMKTLFGGVTTALHASRFTKHAPLSLSL